MNKKVGDKRTFSFSEKTYVISEILENPEIRMEWTWTSGLCPHCKKKIERKFNHTFHKIEILVDDSIDKEKVTRENIILLGDTTDNKKLVLTQEKYDEVFSKSINFKVVK